MRIRLTVDVPLIYQIYKFEDAGGADKEVFVLLRFYFLAQIATCLASTPMSCSECAKADLYDVRLYSLLSNPCSIFHSTAYISFGGLLMALRGSYRHLSNIVVGENVYCLIRK